MDKPGSENIEEKKEKFLNGNNKKKKNDPNSVPIYLMGMLLVLGLIGGYALSIFFSSRGSGTGSNSGY